MSDAESKRGAPGELFVVATPIGNLEDISLRALRMLKECDVIACEDTRQTRKLLSRYDIRTRVVSYHEHNERTRAEELVARMNSGARVALVSDAGTPLVSDPGARLVAMSIAAGVRVTPVPGASAVISALAASGLPAERFVFLGFAPAKAAQRRREFKRIASMTCGEERNLATLVFFEAPHRLAAMLADAAETFGARRAVVARELTKVHEEFVRGTLAELAAWAQTKEPRGEITVLIEGAGENASDAANAGSGTKSLAERVAELMRSGAMERKAALKQAAREMGIKKRDAYRQMLERGDEAGG
jgi:16S rRNA (cytidine1402-2'-O)-methyltransferase